MFHISLLYVFPLNTFCCPAYRTFYSFILLILHPRKLAESRHLGLFCLCQHPQGLGEGQTAGDKKVFAE